MMTMPKTSGVPLSYPMRQALRAALYWPLDRRYQVVTPLATTNTLHALERRALVRRDRRGAWLLTNDGESIRRQILG